MGKSRSIKDALVQVLSEIQNGDEPAFVEVTDSTSKDFEGHPSVRVLPNYIENNKGSMSQNDRDVWFQVVVHLKLEDVTKVQSETIDQMYDLTDLIMDTLDEADFNNTLAEKDRTIGTYMMDADRADWDVVESKGGALLMLVIGVQVSYSKDLDNGVN